MNLRQKKPENAIVREGTGEALVSGSSRRAAQARFPALPRALTLISARVSTRALSRRGSR